MADSKTSWNNKGITYSGKAEREPAGVTNAAPMRIKKPSRTGRKSAKNAIKRGMISEKAAKKHLGDY
jgi:hypothetical protein